MTAEFAVGQHISDYEILSTLGVGGMGKVYKVRNVITDREEAMKILLPDLSSNRSLADRFLREIRVLAALNHPNIAALRTALTYENQLVMIMEYVEGETLANRVARGPISTADAVSYADQVLSALSYAHKQNIIHRDIKPANMMLTSQGTVKLMDFGIARSSKDGSLTTTGTTLGSLNYMPPEQVRGEAADARSDIYSFGVSLYEMLTGRLPFHCDSQYSLMTAHLNEVPPEPITLRGDLPPGLNDIIMLAIAKDPANRFQTADAFRAALSSVPVGHVPASGATVKPAPKSSGATTLMDTPAAPRAATAAAAQRALQPAPTPAPPTMPLTSPPIPPAAIPSPPAARASSSRAAWLALGAVLGVMVLIAAGMYIPRRFGTHADPNKAAFPQNPNGTAANPVTTAAASPADTSAPPLSMPSDPGGAKVDANGKDALENQKGGPEADKLNGSVKVASRQVNSNGGAPEAPATQAPTKNAMATGNPTPSRGTTPAAQVPPPGPSPEEIAKAEDEADQLNVRAAAASHSVDTLRRQQLAAGYNLRVDIASSQERMQLYLAKGDAALKTKDLKNAQKYFDLADAELSKLEKFLGH